MEPSRFAAWAALPADTEPAAARNQCERWRRMPTERKAKLMGSPSAVRQTFTFVDPRARDPGANDLPRTLIVALRVASALDRVGAEHLVGGSLASGFAGEPRPAVGVDFVVALDEESVPAFLPALGQDLYGDEASLLLAARDRSRSGLIDLDSSLKVDLFFLGRSPAEQTQMRRRRKVRVATDPARWLWTYAPEDILLQKLRWFRDGGEVSERHWRDILSIVRVQRDALDPSYCREVAREWGVDDLLERALRDGRAALELPPV